MCLEGKRTKLKKKKKFVETKIIVMVTYWNKIIYCNKLPCCGKSVTYCKKYYCCGNLSLQNDLLQYVSKGDLLQQK